MGTAAQPATFADALRRLRRAAGLTQEALAQRSGLSREAISALERGQRRTPHRDTIELLADGLGLSPTERADLEAAMGPRRHLAPAPAYVTPPNNLPAPPTPLIGRAQDVARAVAMLRRTDVRLLTVTGPAGVGKTRLALEVAADLLHDFADGVLLVRLAALRDPALVASAVAETLGLREQGAHPLPDILTAHLRDKRLLLLLDNFEHVAMAAPLVAELLGACRGLNFLVTSRAVLHLRGEHLLPVQPLDLPDAACLPPADALARVPAVTLFLQRAQAVQPDIALAPGNAAAVAAICRRLDGLPLAIELAAARSRLLPPGALLAQLERPLPVKTGSAHDLPERQQTMARTLQWSYDLLSPREQALFRRLSVFAGGFSMEAAGDVSGAVEESRGRGEERQNPLLDSSTHRLLDSVAALVDKSLLRRWDGSTEQPRLGMLETVREYGRDLLAAGGEADATERAHAAYYLAFAESAAPDLRGSDQTAWLARLEAEHDNLRAALGWARQCMEAELGLRLAGALWRFWWVRGHLSEGRSWLERLLALDGAETVPRVGAAIRAHALYGAGVLAYFQGDCARMVELQEEGLVLYRGLGDKHGLATVLNSLAVVTRDQGDYARATTLQEESLALSHELGDIEGVADALNNLGDVARQQGDLPRAATLFAESLTLRRDLGDTHGEAGALGNLGTVAREQGDRARWRCTKRVWRCSGSWRIG